MKIVRNSKQNCLKLTSNKFLSLKMQKFISAMSSLILRWTLPLEIYPINSQPKTHKRCTLVLNDISWGYNQRKNFKFTSHDFFTTIRLKWT
jgi:hypothetical protein